MNKKGYSTGFSWIFGLIVIFALGLLFIVFNQVFVAYLNPVMEQQVNSSALINDSVRAEITADRTEWMAYWNFVPYIIFFVVIIYMIIAAIRKGEEENV